jgi:outer membrane lipoprotein-sorting protein
MKSHRILLLVLSCVTCFLASTLAQETQRTLTNADIVNMSKSGIGDQTIILMIQKAIPKFDFSADALIDLKKQGVSDAVLNTMLNASAPSPTSSSSKQACGQSFDDVLASVGDHEAIAAVHSTRWTGREVITSPAARNSFNVERVFVLPSNSYFSLQPSDGTATKVVYTPEFNYLTSGKMTTAIPAATLEEIQSSLKLDALNVSQHRDQFTCTLEGSEQVGSFVTKKLRVQREGIEALWNVDSKTNRLLRMTFKPAMSDQVVADFSDWKQINGINVPFTRHIVKGGVITDISIDEYQVNPTTDANLFKAPAGQIATAITFKVLQEKSVPYTVQTNGGISTACNISGATDTTMTASTYGNTTYGTATGTTNLQMNCNSSDTTFRWTHVLNAMLVEASDGNAYIIACDRAWRWLKCVPLRAGDTFRARQGNKGLVVQFFNGKSKEQEATYSILQSRSLR